MWKCFLGSDRKSMQKRSLKPASNLHFERAEALKPLSVKDFDKKWAIRLFFACCPKACRRCI
jgi:hypothetical protein